MKSLARLAPFALFVPMFAFAQDATYFSDILGEIGGLIQAAIPLVFALAFLVFIWGLFKAFILGGSDPEKQAEGKQLMLWAVIGFAVMVSVWGLVNLVTNIFGIDPSETVDIPSLPS